MKSLPKITIIIPCKNSEKTIQRTFDSIRLQNYENLCIPPGPIKCGGFYFPPAAPAASCTSSLVGSCARRGSPEAATSAAPTTNIFATRAAMLSAVTEVSGSATATPCWSPLLQFSQRGTAQSLVQSELPERSRPMTRYPEEGRGAYAAV